MKGKFITLEGCEGVGKSTQIELLRQYLQNTGVDALFLREPGGTELSERIRGILLSPDSAGMCGKCEALLYSAARAQLLYQVIEPALEAGKLVVCDRFTDSTYAYQGVARGLGEEFIASLNKLTCGELKPELTIFLDLRPEEGFARKGGVDRRDRMEMEREDFHRKVYEGYRRIATLEPQRVVAVSSEGSAYQIHNRIVELLRERGITV